jgi:hapalindole-type alkaloid chlorinase
VKKRPSPELPLFDFLDIDAADLARHPSAVLDIRERRLDGVIVRGAFGPETVARVVGGLERGEPPFRCATSRGHPEDAASSHVLGPALASCTPDLVEYFAGAAEFRRSVRALFQGAPDFEGRMEFLFSALAGGRPVSVPAGPDDDTTYTPATFRVLPDGHGIGVHVGHAFLRLPQAKHLSTLLEVSDQLSYFIPLSVPELGGELVVYALERSDVEATAPEPGEAAGDRVDDATGEAAANVELCDEAVFRPGEGDLVLFDGGRYYHRVTPVKGPRPWRAIGGFLAFTRDHTALRYWS